MVWRLFLLRLFTRRHDRRPRRRPARGARLERRAVRRRDRWRPGRTAAPSDVSVVIVVYRTPEHLQRAPRRAGRRGARACAGSASSSTTTRATGAAARSPRAVPACSYVPNERNVGFGRACNQGMRLAAAAISSCTTPISRCARVRWRSWWNCAEREPDAGLVAPRLHYPDGRLQESCRTFYTRADLPPAADLPRPALPARRRIREHLMLDWDHESTREVDWCHRRRPARAARGGRRRRADGRAVLHLLRGRRLVLPDAPARMEGVLPPGLAHDPPLAAGERAPARPRTAGAPGLDVPLLREVELRPLLAQAAGPGAAQRRAAPGRSSCS